MLLWCDDSLPSPVEEDWETPIIDHFLDERLQTLTFEGYTKISEYCTRIGNEMRWS